MTYNELNDPIFNPEDTDGGAESMIRGARTGVQELCKKNTFDEIADTVCNHYGKNVSVGWLYQLTRSADRGSRYDPSVRRVLAVRAMLRDYRKGMLPWLN